MNRPMLAVAYSEHAELKFPLLATPKIDGIRALIVHGKLVSRSFKIIPNGRIRNLLESLLPEGADGEIQCGSFQKTTSVVMSSHDTGEDVTYYWFDWAYDINVPYEDRIHAAYVSYAMSIRHIRFTNIRIIPLVPTTIYDMHGLKHYEKCMLEKGYEGVVVRSPSGLYKNGRSTLSEGYMIKIKQYVDNEAVAVGVEELVHNNNEVQPDNFGNTKRSSSKSGKSMGNMLGAIVARKEDGTLFKIGTGYTAEERRLIWLYKEDVIGRYVKYRCAKKNSKTPHSSVFLGIRHCDDM